MPGPTGLPEGAQFFKLQKFKGLNTKSPRIAIDDEEFSWIENYIPIGDGNLRTLAGPSAAIYTVPGGKTILGFQPFNLGSTFYHIAFLSDGSADLITLPGGSVTHLWPAATFSTSTAPIIAQWGSTYLLVIDVTNGYFIWDGTTTYFGSNLNNTASLAPVIAITNAGTGYTSAPAVGFSGGHGSGAAATAVVSNGSVTKVFFTNAGTGYQPGDTVTVSFTGGGGSNAAATVTLMPTLLAGTDIEVFQSRVWIINGNQLTFSAPASVSNFATSAGGGNATATDSVLRVAFFALRQASGFLYPIADSSIDVINNVVTSGGVTTFNDSNVDPQIGTIWRDSTTVFGRAVILANPSGVHGLYGGAAEKVSPALDGVFPQLQSGWIPTSAQALIYGIRVYFILLKVLDPFGVVRPLMFGWDGTKWFVASQGNNNIFEIATLYQNSIPQCWATDGTTIFQCFTTPSTTLNKKIQPKLWDGGNSVITKDAQRLFVEATDNTGSGVMLTGTIESAITNVAITLNLSGIITFTNASGGIIQFQNNSLGNINFTGAGAFLNFQNVNMYGKELGFTLNSTSPDFTIKTISLMYIPSTGY